MVIIAGNFKEFFMERFGRIFAILVLGVIVASCGVFSKEKSAGISEKIITPVSISDAAVKTMSLRNGREAVAVELVGGRSNDINADLVSVLDIRLIYFTYDSSEIVGEYVEVIEAHANYLISNPEAKLVLEGHTDERGSREYNLALGERRAQSVQRRLNLLGVSEPQVLVVTYGEERPVELKHNEGAYAFNRRVEIVYR